MLFTGYIATYWSFTLIIAADAKKGGHRSMKEFLAVCGGPSVSRAYEIITIFYLYGALFGYQVLSKM
jgi:hypothetical protein